MTKPFEEVPASFRASDGNDYTLVLTKTGPGDSWRAQYESADGTCGCVIARIFGADGTYAECLRWAADQYQINRDYDPTDETESDA